MSSLNIRFLFDLPSILGEDDKPLFVHSLGATHGVAVEVHLVLVRQRVQVNTQVLPFTLAPVRETENKRHYSICVPRLLD